MKTKELYITPETESIELRLENGILVGSEDYGEKGQAGKSLTYNSYNEDF